MNKSPYIKFFVIIWIRCYELFRLFLFRSSDKHDIYCVTSTGLIHSFALPVLLGSRPLLYSRILPVQSEIYLGWGRKPSGCRAVSISKALGKKFKILEDGFLRSFSRNDESLSLIFDHKGIYYDATEPYLLEDLIPTSLSGTERQRSLFLMDEWCRLGLSKTNASPEYDGDLSQPYILVIDQTFGDLSIKYGMATPESFNTMLTAALKDNPEHHIILKTHPDTKIKGKKTHFDVESLRKNSRMTVIDDPVHPVRLIKNADAVYTVTSQVGFEALIHGKPVKCFGMPFYAGWGLTEDTVPAPKRRCRISLEQLLYAALIKYPKYINLITQQICEIEQVMEYIADQRKRRFKLK